MTRPSRTARERLTLLVCGVVASCLCLLPSTARAAPDVAIVGIDVSRTGITGEAVTYELTLANNGDATASNYPVSFYLAPVPQVTQLNPLLGSFPGPALSPGQTLTMAFPVTLPSASDTSTYSEGLPFRYTLGAIVDPRNVLKEPGSTRANNSRFGTPTLIAAPSADFVALSVQWGTRAAAGTVVPVTFEAANEGVVNGETRISFFVSTNNEITSNDLEVGQIRVALAAGGQLRQTAWINLPSGLNAGSYYLGMVLNADGEQPELDSENNTVVSAASNVSAAALYIQNTALADALFGVPYVQSLIANGGNSAYEWRLAGGTLPLGLSLTPNGLLSGTPGSTGTFAPVIEVRSGEAIAQAVFIIRAYSPTAALEVATKELPPVVVSQQYEVPLAALGGTPPYRWSIVSGALPLGLSLSENGLLTGQPPTPGNGVFTVQVTDNAGSTAKKALSIRAINAGDLAILQSSIDDAVAGKDFRSRVQATGGTQPYRWSLAAGTLPPGLALSQQDEGFVLSGRPTVDGLFTFSVRVEDSIGQSDRTQLALLVKPGFVQILTTELPNAVKGQPYDATLAASSSEVVWSVESGELPVGLALSPDGRVRGTVSSGAAARNYTLLVTARDVDGGVGRMGLSLAVQSAATEEDASGGCASVGSSALALLVLTAMRRLRRRSAAAFAFAAIFALPLAALANPYAVVTEPADYEPLVGGTPLAAGTSSSILRTIPLPTTEPVFSFPYFGQQITTFHIAINGYLVLGPTESTNTTGASSRFPTTSALVKNAVAPYWTYLYTPATTGPPMIRWELRGTWPNRVLIVEWSKVSSCSTTTCAGATFTFQARLSESGEIAFHYGEKSGFGSQYTTVYIGMQNETGTIGYNAPQCLTGCKFSEWPTGQRVRFTRLANLVGMSLATPPVIYGDIPATFSASIGNSGATNATGVTADVYLSQIAGPSDSMVHVWSLTPQDIPAGAPKQFSSSTVRAPLTLTPGVYYPVMDIDPTNTVPQSGPTKRILVGSPIKIGAPGPDLLVASVTGHGARASHGESVPVTVKLANLGNQPALARWRVVLSLTDAPSLSDRIVREGTHTLAPNQVEDVDGAFTVPSNLLPGTYYVGAVVTVDDEAPQTELNAFNNAERSTSSLTITGPLAIVTEALPDAAVGAQYAFRLLATGGDGLNLWTLPNGESLPQGLALSTTGDITGVHTVAGTKQFKVNLTSNQNQTVSATFTLSVTAPGLPLAFPTTQLPAAIFELEYAAQLLATGGTPPYSFTLRNGSGANVLPIGLAFDPNGAITGVPRQAGTFNLTVDVTDRAGTRLTRELTLIVVPSTRPFVDVLELPDAVLAKDYRGFLSATGGTRPYKWQPLLVRRLGDATGASVDVDRVPGLTLSEDGILSGVPARVGVYEIAVRLKDASNATALGTVMLTVRTDEGLAILTRQLSTAEVGKPYDQQLVVAGGDGQLRFALDSVEQPLPVGLSLDVDGHVRGTPTRSGRVTFIVRVSDGSGRTDARALTIDVRTAQDSGGGCSGAGMPGMFGLTALLLCLRRRRIAASASVVSVALMLIALSGCSAKNELAAPCSDVACQPGEVCDPTDNLCKCGSVTGRACSEFEQCNPSTSTCELLDRCFLVDCVRNMVCDPADGQCKCGAETCGPGTVCSPQENTCLAKDPCENVACASGMTCDSLDGRCKCGGTNGALCGVGEKCENGVCRQDLCASVSCTGGTTCDPADGRCHCGGPGGDVCIYGQTCAPLQKKCITSSACASVRCPGGASCDPADGSCRCGGAGGPTCGGNQTCDFVQQQCLGGDQCFNKVCPTNTVCDPEDGACRCGAGGTVCGAQQLCVGDNVNSRVCRTQCDPSTQTPCESGEACHFDTTTKIALCGQPGVKAEGETCDGNNQCGRGLGCVLTAGTTRTCRAYCALPEGACADTARICKTFAGATPEMGACLP